VTTYILTRRMLSDFGRQRIAKVLSPRDAAALTDYLLHLHATATFPPMRKSELDWQQIAAVTAIPFDQLLGADRWIRGGFDALVRSLSRLPPSKAASLGVSRSKGTSVARAPAKQKDAPLLKRRGRPPKARSVVDFPEPQWELVNEPDSFSEYLRVQMRRHGDTAKGLHRALKQAGFATDERTIRSWRTDFRAPRGVESLEVLSWLDRRYRLAEGHFRQKLEHPGRAASGLRLHHISRSEQRRLAWHLPEDFSRRPIEEQEKILEWVRRVVVAGATDYRRYQATAMRQKFAVRFRSLEPGRRPRHKANRLAHEDLDVGLVTAVVDAPALLEGEMADLLRFKTATLTGLGLQRNGVWGAETASQKVEHLGLMFGALAAPPRSAVRGYGARLEDLCFAMLIFPPVWDWYLGWRERRRGFFTAWEIDMLSVVLGLVREKTGWIRQSPSLAARLRPVDGLISEADISLVHADWAAACDRLHEYGRNRIRELQRVVRVHRDPFEPILPVLEAPSPLAEYRKITEEILRHLPNERRYPKAAAEAVRAFLMLRIGLHTGLRQKNLRELLVCPKGQTPTPERHLEDRKRGELRWSDRDGAWEILVPAIAFKNASSSFFGAKPFRLLLPDLGRLYEMIDAYMVRHRGRLLGSATDPGTFFIKSVKQSSAEACYDQNTFYEAWRLAIQRYGIYNPYTGRGAIEGLLPHGPHNIRDVLATHVLKQTGSYEQASYAIQDTPDMVAKHYGRFLPGDKSAMAAEVLNKVWSAA
jgi:hypothetical protein